MAKVKAPPPPPEGLPQFRHRPVENDMKIAEEYLNTKVPLMSPNDVRDYELCNTIRQVWMRAKTLKDRYPKDIEIDEIMENCITLVAMGKRMDTKLLLYKSRGGK